MRSIRTRLFLILLAATGVVWLSALLWIQHSTRAEVQHVLDRRLQESARMVASLIARQGGAGPDMDHALEQAPALDQSGTHVVSHQLICQVWGFDGSLKSESAGSPQARLAGNDSGFSETTITRDGHDEIWRVYTHVDTDLGIRVMVGDARAMRDRLVRGVIMGLLAPALLILPLTAVLIWGAVGSGLSPLAALARRMKQRPATDLSPLADVDAPQELQPMLAALNGLFARVEGQRDREQNFTAFAAHELKTPLAGIKTQAQIAAMAEDPQTRAHALRQIQRGVDRTDRLVRQLLDMAAADGAGPLPAGQTTNGQRLIDELVQDLRPLAQSRAITLRLRQPQAPWMTQSAALLAPALRNLIENAILASPPDSEVEIDLTQDDQGLRVSVGDRGPGIAATDRAHITERFYRGSRPAGGNGSGLGLAIVAAAVERLGGSLELGPRAGGGEYALIRLPAEPALRA